MQALLGGAAGLEGGGGVEELLHARREGGMLPAILLAAAAAAAAAVAVRRTTGISTRAVARWCGRRRGLGGRDDGRLDDDVRLVLLAERDRLTPLGRRAQQLLVAHDDRESDGSREGRVEALGVADESRVVELVILEPRAVGTHRRDEDRAHLVPVELLGTSYSHPAELALAEELPDLLILFEKGGDDAYVLLLELAAVKGAEEIGDQIGEGARLDRVEEGGRVALSLLARALDGAEEHREGLIGAALAPAGERGHLLLRRRGLQLVLVRDLREQLDERRVRAVVAREVGAQPRVGPLVERQPLHPLHHGAVEPVERFDLGEGGGAELLRIPRHDHLRVRPRKRDGEQRLRLHELRRLVDNNVRKVALRHAAVDEHRGGARGAHDERRLEELLQGRRRERARLGVVRAVLADGGVDGALGARRRVQPEHLSCLGQLLDERGHVVVGGRVARRADEHAERALLERGRPRGAIREEEPQELDERARLAGAKRSEEEVRRPRQPWGSSCLVGVFGRVHEQVREHRTLLLVQLLGDRYLGGEPLDGRGDGRRARRALVGPDDVEARVVDGAVHHARRVALDVEAQVDARPMPMALHHATREEEKERLALHPVDETLELHVGLGAGEPGEDSVGPLDRGPLLGEVGAVDAHKRIREAHIRLGLHELIHVSNLNVVEVVRARELALLGLLEPEEVVEAVAVVVLRLPRVEVRALVMLHSLDDARGERVRLEDTRALRLGRLLEVELGAGELAI